MGVFQGKLFSGEKLKNLEFSSHNPEEVRLSPDKRMLAIFSYGEDKSTIMLKNIEMGDESCLPVEYVGKCLTIEAFDFSPDSKLIALGNPDEDMLLIWDVLENRSIYLSTDEDPIYCVAFSPDSKILAYGGHCRLITLLDVESGKIIRELRGHTGIVETLAFSPDGKTLASSSWDGTVRLWEL